MNMSGLSAVLVAAEVGCCLLFFSTFFQERYPTQKWRKRIGYFAILFLSWIAANVLWKHILIKTIVIMLELILCMKILYVGTWKKIILFLIWYYSIGFAFEALFHYFFNRIGLNSASANPSWKFVAGAGICKLFLLLCLLLLRQKNLNDSKEFALMGREWIYFSFFPFFSLIICIQVLSEEQLKGNTAILISIELLFHNFVFYFLLQNTKKRKEIENKLALIQEQTQHQAREYRYIQESYEQQRKKAAEFRKELHVIKEFLQKEDVCGGLSYLDRCDQNLAYRSNYFNTTNKAINTVLTHQYLEAKKEGIALIYEITRITNLPLAEEKAMVLLSTLLCCGIDFCKTHKFTQFHCKLAEQGPYLVLALKMPCPQGSEEWILENWKKNVWKDAFCQIVRESNGEEQLYVDHPDRTICYTILFRKKEC